MLPVFPSAVSQLKGPRSDTELKGPIKGAVLELFFSGSHFAPLITVSSVTHLPSFTQSKANRVGHDIEAAR